MKLEITLNELRTYRQFILNYKTTSKMVNELKNLLAFNFGMKQDFGEGLNAVSLFADKTLAGKCSGQQYKHPTNATKRFLKAVLEYQETVLK